MNRWLLALVALPATAFALINPQYTVTDLLKDSGAVYVLRVTAPADGKVSAEIVEALVGELPAAKKLTFDFTGAEDLPEETLSAAFGGAKTALAVMCVQKKKQDGARVAALEIGTKWIGLTQTDTATVWTMDRDPHDLETVWGSSARQLVPAIRYALGDPAASFPVATTLKWSRDVALGKLAGAAHGGVWTEDGVIILSSGGDRVFEPGTKGKPPVDVTGKLGLTTKSKALVTGDFNGDEQCDVASWDGAKLWLALRGKDGKFAAPTGGFELAECLSLAWCAGEFVVGTASGVTLLKPDGTQRKWSGPGGPCAVADFDGTGTAEVVQVTATGLARYNASSEPVTVKVPTITQPKVILAGDYDADGKLDLLVAGRGGVALLWRDAENHWHNVMAETGEMGEGTGAENDFIAACPSDFNGDGRLAAAMFDAATAPGFFFNRGFACFGVARSLSFTESKLPAAVALGKGQQAGIVGDWNGDKIPDLLAVDRDGQMWFIAGEGTEPQPFQLRLTTAQSGPVNVRINLGPRNLGVWVVRPGEVTVVTLPEAGEVTLRWKTPSGEPVTRNVPVLEPVRLKL
jgi:hypothetical protein